MKNNDTLGGKLRAIFFIPSVLFEAIFLLPELAIEMLVTKYEEKK